MKKPMKHSLVAAAIAMVYTALQWRTTTKEKGVEDAAYPRWLACIYSPPPATSSRRRALRNRKLSSSGYALMATVRCPVPARRGA